MNPVFDAITIWSKQLLYRPIYSFHRLAAFDFCIVIFHPMHYNFILAKLGGNKREAEKCS